MPEKISKYLNKPFDTLVTKAGHGPMRNVSSNAT